MEDNSKLIADINYAIEALDKAIKHYEADCTQSQLQSVEQANRKTFIYPHKIIANFRSVIRAVYEERETATSTAQVLNFGEENRNG
ncbi:hypothetical protein [Rhizobium sp. Leaf262]|uniref:hypothetical protein n=1 Tax=Rhizobium sp. Leaf262 TaxID=1736312 RepID=UPI0007127557|nr:hypothetical protein [Rhizobium sp. Leaf262]KQO79466.1 hypothetical protein ASF29_23435 [Rhizobium sp. Leaf262]